MIQDKFKTHVKNIKSFIAFVAVAAVRIMWIKTDGGWETSLLHNSFKRNYHFVPNFFVPATLPRCAMHMRSRASACVLHVGIASFGTHIRTYNVVLLPTHNPPRKEGLWTISHAHQESSIHSCSWTVPLRQTGGLIVNLEGTSIMIMNLNCLHLMLPVGSLSTFSPQ